MAGVNPVPASTIAGPLMLGNRGQSVQDLQSLLNKATVPSPGLAVDGNFGIKTDAAVRAFQKRKGLTADGIVGPRTAQALGAGFVLQRQVPPKPNPPGTLPQSSTVTPAAVLAGVIAKELKQIARVIDSSFDNGFDENPDVFTRSRKALKFGLNRALLGLVSAMRGGLAPDLVAFEVASVLVTMAGTLGVVANELKKGGVDASNVTTILADFSTRIVGVRDVVRRTLAGQLEGGVRAGSTLLRDLLGPLSN